MRLHPHISFGGECEAAFRFYEQCFGGRLATLLTWGDSPMKADAPPEWHEKICHATLTVGADSLMGADVLPEQYQPLKGFQMLLEPDDPTETDRIFEALAEKGTVHMPLQKTFWAVRFGVVTDRFGVTWEINCER